MTRENAVFRREKGCWRRCPRCRAPARRPRPPCHLLFFTAEKLRRTCRRSKKAASKATGCGRADARQSRERRRPPFWPTAGVFALVNRCYQYTIIRTKMRQNFRKKKAVAPCVRSSDIRRESDDIRRDRARCKTLHFATRPPLSYFTFSSFMARTVMSSSRWPFWRRRASLAISSARRGMPPLSAS